LIVFGKWSSITVLYFFFMSSIKIPPLGPPRVLMSDGHYTNLRFAE
jgi:hypothetical protein